MAVAAEEKATAAERAGGDVSRLKSWCHLSRDRPKSHEMYDVVTCQKFSKKKTQTENVENSNRNV